MRTASVSWLAGLLVATVVGAGLYWLTDVLALSVAAALVWGSAAGTSHWLARRFPGRASGSDWTDSRWAGLGVGVITFAGLLGVNAVDGLPTELRSGLSAVVLGTGYVGYVTGSMAELERSAE